MSGYAIALIVFGTATLGGFILAVIAGGIAVHAFPDENDARRNEERFVRPAFWGAVATVVGMIGLLITGVVWVIGWLDTLLHFLTT